MSNDKKVEVSFDKVSKDGLNFCHVNAQVVMPDGEKRPPETVMSFLESKDIKDAHDDCVIAWDFFFHIRPENKAITDVTDINEKTGRNIFSFHPHNTGKEPVNGNIFLEVVLENDNPTIKYLGSGAKISLLDNKELRLRYHEEECDYSIKLLSMKLTEGLQQLKLYTNFYFKFMLRNYLYSPDYNPEKLSFPGEKKRPCSSFLMPRRQLDGPVR